MPDNLLGPKIERRLAMFWANVQDAITAAMAPMSAGMATLSKDVKTCETSVAAMGAKVEFDVVGRTAADGFATIPYGTTLTTPLKPIVDADLLPASDRSVDCVVVSFGKSSARVRTFHHKVLVVLGDTIEPVAANVRMTVRGVR